MHQIFLGLGSNLGDRGKNLQEALVLLEKWGVSVTRSSSIYKTAPVGYENQSDFYNMAVRAETKFSPGEMLNVLHTIERALGRVRSSNMLPFGPRTIDLDLLFFDDKIINKKELRVPHPRANERRFVLVPMVEIAKLYLHPVLKKTIKELLKECTDKSIVTLL